MGPPLEVGTRRLTILDRIRNDSDLRWFISLMVTTLAFFAMSVLHGIDHKKVKRAETILKGIANDDYPAVIMERANDDRWAKHYAMSYFDPAWTDPNGRKHH